MTRYAEVSHEEWIAAPEARVRSQFADVQHHIDTQVHAKLQLRVLERAGAAVSRYEQRVKLLGITQRDVFERRFTHDGGMVDTSVEGFNEGGSLSFRFAPEQRGGADGTRVDITVRLPLPPLVGVLVKPLLMAQVRKELAAAAAEDKHDLEVRGYHGAVPVHAAAAAFGAAA